MNWYDLFFTASWIALLGLTLLIRVAVGEAAWVHDRARDALGEPKQESLLMKGAKPRFSAGLYDSDVTLTEADLLGAPATVVLALPSAVATDEARRGFLNVVQLSARRSRGRLWVLLQGPEDAFRQAINSLRKLKVTPYVLRGLERRIAEVIPETSGLLILNLDSDGQVLTYGHLNSSRNRRPVVRKEGSYPKSVISVRQAAAGERSSDRWR